MCAGTQLMAHQAVQIIGGIDPATTALLASLGGRYRILSELGRGGFGQVFLAEDDLLRRRVAIKALRKARRETPGNGFVADTAFLAEARMVARMEHPGIVPVYDVIELEEGGFCIISRYIEGQTLREQLHGQRLSSMQAAQITIGLCEALNHAHKLGVVHRDVKPANIMLTEELRPLLLDFGLARSWGGPEGEGYAAGTPGYMSPEQARGEDHLINNRSDIFSLGLVFYEMLTGQQAFPCGSARQQLELIESGGPPSPRQIDPRVPKELERICLKAMQPQIRTRYMMTADMVEDLRQWQAAMSETVVPQPQMGVEAAHKAAGANGARAAQATEPHSSKPRVVPRGLRAFDQGDADFFLTLVPGPRDRFGLPENLRFWKQRIESDDPSSAFRVGVLYGPSGCGKSSLVRAGLLPHCADHVTVLFHEARSSGNAARLGRSLWQKFPSLAPFGDSPAMLLQKLRHNGLLRGGRKLLVVIDQAEQWLRSGETQTVETVADSHGETLAAPAVVNLPEPEEGQALLNTLRQCDGTQVQALILVRDDFWRSVSRILADADVELDNNNSALVDLFEPRHAEMVLESFGRAYGCLPEDPATALPKAAREFIQQSVRSLEQDRRVSPVRLALFAEMFRDREWTPEGLRQVGGVSGVAVTFLEETFRGSSARGPHRVHEQAARQVLQLFVPETGDVRGAAHSQADMLAISGYESRPQLFRELLHVLDADLRLLTPVDTLETTDGQASWQLTHDHMVSALREWLLARKADSIRGRAEIAMHERAHEWCQRPSPARLPGMLEWLRLRLLTKRVRWTKTEARWMKAGMRRARRWGISAIIAAAACGLILHEARGYEHGKELAARVLTAPPDKVPSIMSQGAAWFKWAQPQLAQAALEPITTTAGINARLALVPSDSSHVTPLAKAMLNTEEAQTLGAIREALEKRQGEIPLEIYRTVLVDATATNSRKLRAFAAMASFAPEDAALKGGETSAARWLLTSVNEIAGWAALLRPLGKRLSPSLEEILLSDNHAEQANAALALAALHADEPTELVRMIALVPASSVPPFAHALQPHPSCRELLTKIVAPPVAQDKTAARKILSATEESAYRGHANTLLAGLSLGVDQKFWPFLKRDADRTLRTFLFLNAAAAGVPPDVLATRLLEEKDPGIRQALLLALCGYPMSAQSAALQDRMLVWMRGGYASDPDGGVHSSIATLMKHWSLEAELQQLQKALPRGSTPASGYGWWITPSGMDMRVVSTPDGRRFAISACEVTVEDYQRFQPAPKLWSPKLASGPLIPVTGITWHMAAQYCEWLSNLERLPPDARCYVGNGDAVRQHPEALQRKGYRLPTTVEWRAASFGTEGSRWDFGNARSLSLHFAWMSANSGGTPKRVSALLPNSAGLWDAQGNVGEWSHDWEPSHSGQTGLILGASYATLLTEFESLDARPTNFSTVKLEAGMRLACSLPTEKK